MLKKVLTKHTFSLNDLFYLFSVRLSKNMQRKKMKNNINNYYIMDPLCEIRLIR